MTAQPQNDSPTTLAHDEALKLLKKWLSVSESQVCALETLRNQLPEVNTLLADSFDNISQKFVTLAGNMQKIEAASSDGNAPEEIRSLTSESRQMIQSLIVDLQFQDRVSQNLVITMNVLNAVIRYLEEETDLTIEALNHENEKAELDRKFAQNLLGLLNLGELQGKFIQHLVDHQYIDSPEALSCQAVTLSESKETDDDVELF